MATYQTDIELPPDPSRVMEGLRDTGYEFNTAVADIIDNSIAANAKHIHINISCTPTNEIYMYLADDGCGMTFDELKNAMTYGSKVRQDPSSLGKFGLGLKTASTAFCRCLSVISRGSNFETNKVQWDIDYVIKTGGWNLRHLEPTDDELEYLYDLIGENTGTLVVWEKIDRLLKKSGTPAMMKKGLGSIEEDLRFHISMVYQRFLDKNDTRARDVEIVLNNVPVTYWDPFCVNEENTEVVGDEKLMIEMGDKEAPLSIKAYLIPRRDEFSTSEAGTKARVTNDMQGFYTYRENRLIHYGDWMKMFINEPHGSLLRVELSFGHELDDAFNVDIKKSRILLNDEIFRYIKDQFLPSPRRAANERYRTGVRKNIEKSHESTHDASNRNISSKASSVENSKLEVINPESGEVRVSNSNGSFVTNKITIKNTENKNACRVNPVPSLDDGTLWRPAIINGEHGVEINMSHPFYQKIYYPIRKQNVLVTGIDSLLWALAEAESSVFNRDTLELFEDLRVLTSRALKKLVMDLPEPTDDE
ncbi:hypothetical protein AOA81_06365 [Methanomassiliicoccales archaeon RumEn M2]|nr:hypothetical protein AOA81_06365 [Methanomassiliicoccales archaeon RumEn M2]